MINEVIECKICFKKKRGGGHNADILTDIWSKARTRFEKGFIGKFGTETFLVGPESKTYRKLRNLILTKAGDFTC